MEVEVVCVYDDGSTDETFACVEKFIPLFCARGVMLRIEKGLMSHGVGYAKNRAASMACGRFLCFCDADDRSEPSRLQSQYELATAIPDDKLAFVGCNFVRQPEGSTARYTRWANSLGVDKLRTQVYTSHGPTLIAPSWFISYELYMRLKGFREDIPFYPEDLEFFFRALDFGDVHFSKVNEPLVMYRYHPGCASFGVHEDAIWKLRIDRFCEKILPTWKCFTIWSAGKQGKRFFKSLPEERKGHVVSFCDVDEKKIKRGLFEEYDEIARVVRWKVPIVHVKDAHPPLVICVKLDLTGGDLERLVAESGWIEGRDYIHFG
ncbi:unnamed protein product [Heligmosomoides polygyrus]|uniref:Glyco_trans_2-like domain-containing protein n=1 Tax=Heligmosomoides polygyrus TaxID=6339 RepID=A0A183F2N1_HELPZ|nr:unnamed protein product [Heligmosomoides polygyrus]